MFARLHFSKGALVHSEMATDPKIDQNWNRRWKFAVISLSTTLSFTQGLGPLALAPMFGQLIESFHSDLASVVRFTGVCILVLGFSNFIW
jgi:hypothetical protein